MQRTLIALLACAAVATSGCRVGTMPTTVSRLDDRKPATMTRADWNGQYTLYHVSADRKAARETVQTVHLNKGEPIGFRTRESGVVAVAGELEVPIPGGTYLWVMVADSGQKDPVMTGVLVTVIVVAVVVVGALICIAATVPYIPPG